MYEPIIVCGRTFRPEVIEPLNELAARPPGGLHLSMNMWCDWDAPELKGDDSIYRPELRFDRSLWDDLLKKMQQAGMNMVVIDLGDGVKYESHPEIAVKGAWSTAELRRLSCGGCGRSAWSRSRS